MKRLVACYEVGPPEAVHRGIPVGKENEIVLGESGRGRLETRVPLPEGSIIQDGIVYEIPVSHPTASAVICIRDLSGYRGTWELLRPLPAEVIFEYARTGDLEVLAQAAEPVTPPLLIAYGRKAQGAAGRMGHGDELLFITRPDESYDIVRYGRIYGRPRLLRLVVHEDRVDLYDLAAWARRVDALNRW
jgi:hypothetical protein